jgi:hypothetical protein
MAGWIDQRHTGFYEGRTSPHASPGLHEGSSGIASLTLHSYTQNHIAINERSGSLLGSWCHRQRPCMLRELCIECGRSNQSVGLAQCKA